MKVLDLKNHSETQAALTWSFRHGHLIHLSLSYMIVYYYDVHIKEHCFHKLSVSMVLYTQER